jgi:hypothetical protein
LAFHVIRREWVGHLGEELTDTSDNVFVVELRHAEYVAVVVVGVAAFAAITPPQRSAVTPKAVKPFFQNFMTLPRCPSAEQAL